MVVAFTPNIGLAKPDESELALNWARSTQLQDDNNQIIIDKTDINIVTYTPTFKGATVDPSIGSGTSKGEYQDIQGIIIGSFVLDLLDPGVAVGTGEYGISLPAVADGTFYNVGTVLTTAAGTFSVIGEGYIYDSSSVGNSGNVVLDVVTISGVSYARLVTETFAGKTSSVVRNAMPFSIATADKLSGNFCYKKA